MAKAVIMQPTYLPWLGYFDLMDQADIFVLLDSVQFDKRSWQQRNRIKSPRGELMLTIPVLTKGKFDQRICDVKVDPTYNFSKEHTGAIKLNYAKAIFFKKYFDSIEGLLNKRQEYLCDFTISFILWIRDMLGIKTKLIRSSSLNVDQSKAELLVQICQAVGAGQYLSPLRSKDYIGDGRLFADNHIELIYHQYTHPEYKQLFGEFIPHLSAVDLLLNEGDASLAVIRSGREVFISQSNKLNIL